MAVTPEELRTIIARDGDRAVPVNVVVEKYLDVSRPTVYRLCESGDLRYVLVGRSRGIRVYLSSILTHLERSRDN